MTDPECMTLTEAKAVFYERPTPALAANLLTILMVYEAEGGIDDDSFFNGVAEVRDWLAAQADPSGGVGASEVDLSLGVRERVLAPEAALLAIQRLLDGTEWSADTIEAVASVMVEAGYRIGNLGDYDDDEPSIALTPEGERAAEGPMPPETEDNVNAKLQQLAASLTSCLRR